MTVKVTHSTLADGTFSSTGAIAWDADHTLVGVGTMAEQNANSVAITGGTISGVTLPASNITGTLDVGHGGTGATTLTGYVKGTGTAALTAASTIPNTDITGLGTASTKDAGAALGVATLDAGGKVPTSQIPLQGDLNYQGTWNATTNSPTLTSSTGTQGYYYVVSVAGTTNLNGITDWQIGDWAIFNGTVWQKVDNTDAVTSVNGQVGTVVLTQADISGTVPTSRTITAGTGLSGGGDLSANRTIALANTAVTAGTYGSDSRSITQIVDAQGRLTSVIDQPIAIANTQVSGLGTMSTQNANSVAITGGAINGTTVGATTASTGAFTTATASTSVTTPIVQASNSGGLSLKNSAGTTQISMGAGGGDNASINVSTNINGTNAQIDISPTGTGHVHMKPTGTGSIEIAPTNVGTMDNMTIGATTARAITGTTITATSFVGSGASLTNVVNSLTASTGISVSGSTGAVTVTNTAPDQTVSIASGTGISATGTYPNFTVTNTAPDQTVALSNGTGISVTGTYPNFTITNTAPSSGGTVTSVTGTAPVVSSGGNTPAISMAAATGSVPGYLTAADWTTFNSKQPAGTYVNSVSATSPITSSGGTTPTIAMPAATGSVNGYLTSTDWTTFNNKGSGTVTSVSGTSGRVTSTGGATPVIDLAASGVSANTYGSSTAIPVITFDTYGRATTVTTAAVAGGQYYGTAATKAIAYNSNSIAEDITILANTNGLSAGPITISTGYTVTVATGAVWVIV